MNARYINSIRLLQNVFYTVQLYYFLYYYIQETMFIEKTNLPGPEVIKVYLRLKDKKSFPLMLKLPILSSDLKEVVTKKTKISPDDLVVMSQGKQINLMDQKNELSFKDKSILHVINKKNLRNDIIELLIRFVLRNEEKSCLGETKIIAKFNQSIQEFIQKLILPIIEEMTTVKIKSDEINLVSNGIVLMKSDKFNDYLVEDGAEIICMINFVEELEKSVNNLSTHKLIAAHRQIIPIKIMSFKSEEKLPSQSSNQNNEQKKQTKSQIKDKSESFLKLEQFDSTNIPSKRITHTRKEETQKKSEEPEKKVIHRKKEVPKQRTPLKLKKKDKISEEVAQKFQKQMHKQQQKLRGKELPIFQKRKLSTATIQRQKQKTEKPQRYSVFETKQKTKTPQKDEKLQKAPTIKLGDLLFVSQQKKMLPFSLSKLGLNFTKALRKDELDENYDENISVSKESSKQIQKHQVAQHEITEGLSSVKMGDFIFSNLMKSKQPKEKDQDFISNITNRFNEILDQKIGDAKQEREEQFKQLKKQTNQEIV